MAYITKQTGKYTARIRLKVGEAYESGFETKREARAWAEETEALMANQQGPMKGLGPRKTTLGAALWAYAHDAMVNQKGCLQALCKVNKYLRAAGLPTLRATLVQGGLTFAPHGKGHAQQGQGEVASTLFTLQEDAVKPVFQAPRQAAFAQRADANQLRDAGPQAVRERLSRMLVADIRGFHIAELLKAMAAPEAGYAGATQRQEIAILSSFFGYAKKTWSWPLGENPTLAVNWPTGNMRDRVLSKEEGERLAAVLEAHKNIELKVFVLLALETTMRKSELLHTARWGDVIRSDDGDVLRLVVDKTGQRDVPLTPFALELLKLLPQGEAHEGIFSMTDSALGAAWRRVCKAADIKDFCVHDARHSGATNFSKFLNIFELQKVTGHKSLASLRRYINLKAQDVAMTLRTLPGPTVAQSLYRSSAAVEVKPQQNLPLLTQAKPETEVAGSIVISFAQQRALRRA